MSIRSSASGYYRSTVEFSTKPQLQKGLQNYKAGETQPAYTSTFTVDKRLRKMLHALMTPYSPVLLSISLSREDHQLRQDGKEKFGEADLDRLKTLYSEFVYDILGLKDETSSPGNQKLTDDLIGIISNLRLGAKERKDWQLSDRIRDDLKKAGVILKDTKDGTHWEII
jgi:cysteinyl-tRNA synthetase